MTSRATSPPPQSPGTHARINFTSPTHSAAAAARNSIMSSSAKGWSPLQINKRDSVATSPTKLRDGSGLTTAATDSPQSTSTSGPRRTSSSYKHMATNSLVSNSPFKNHSASSHPPSREVIHERRTSRNLGESPVKAAGASSTPKSAIGLGISANRSRVPSGNGSAINGTRRVSSGTKPKAVFHGVTGERKGSGTINGDRRSSASKENESPDVRASKRTPVKATGGLKNLAGREYVSKSPFLDGPTNRTLSGRLQDENSPYGGSGLGPGPGQSPKTSFPLQRDDVFSSPSPTPRRVSPSKPRGAPVSPSHQQDSSPTPSPSRPPTNNAQLGRPAPPSAGHSPLRRDFGSVSQNHTPTPTPARSSMTPSRRLRGPRDFADGVDSPSKVKTVTFQTVPDVKEFERMSIEGSANSSFEMDEGDEEEEEEQEWLEDSLRDSLDDLLHEGVHDDDDDEEEEVGHGNQLRVTNPDYSPERESSNGDHDGSTTDRFVNSLLEEDLFSPPQGSTPAFSDQPVFSGNGTPELSTPSLGGEATLHVAPMLATASTDSQPDAAPVFKDKDSAGIPYGRTHHAERAAVHHARTASSDRHPHVDKIAQIPTQKDEQMLFNRNASEPAVPTPKAHKAASQYSTPFDDGPHATQDGPMPDPFITVQTATSVFSPHKEEPRTEGGIPLGRTSHADRIHAARQLATQNLGLGMPRSPAVSRDLMDVKPDLEVERRQQEMDRVEAEKEKQKASQELKRQSMPPPRPMQLDLPEPVSKTTPEHEVKKADNTNRYSLPFINLTSPFFKSAPSVPTNDYSGSDTASGSGSDADRPLTPPPRINDDGKQRAESPHRIPSFEFEEISLQAVETVETKTAKVQRSPTKQSSGNGPTSSSTSASSISSTGSTSTSSGSTRSANSARSPAKASDSDFGIVKSGSASSPSKQDSTTTRVRQRISREMIRDTINQRIADGSLSRRSSQFMGTSDNDYENDLYTQRSANRVSSPPSSSRQGRTPLGEAKAIPMTKSHTTDSTGSRKPSGGTTGAIERPSLRPRSQTQSAHEVLKASEKDGVIGEPRSALDKLMDISPGAGARTPGRPLTITTSSPSSKTLPRPQDPSSASTPTKRASAPPGPAPTSALSVNTGTPTGRDKPLPSPSRIGMVSFEPIDEMPQTPTRGASGLPHTPTRRADSRGPKGSDTPSSVAGGEGMAAREAAIIAKRREKEGGGSNPADWSSGIEQRNKQRRRSVSTSDARLEAGLGSVKSAEKSLGNPRLTLGIDEDGIDILQSFREEAANIGADRPYKVREKPMVHASYGEKVTHSKAGDLETGKAWRSLRRPSDMNEHAAEIRAMRTREANAGKASGTIFVKVLGIEGLTVPIPQQQTFFCVTLDNGIDYIRTPYAPLVPNAKVNQEFSLVEHPNFEFSLSLDIRRDPHILKAIHEKLNPPAPPPPVSPVKSSSGLKSLFASPRKPRLGKHDSSRIITPVPAPPPPSHVDNMARYLATPSSSTIAKTHVAFKPIAKQCEAKILEIRYPMFAMFKGDGVFNGDVTDLTTSTSGTSAARKQLAKITLQIFRLPPIPGLRPEDMPQCIDDCLRGMRHHAWHSHEYQEGVLTQEGGDCNHPRRRLFKLIGGNLIAINEVTKKEVTSIDLRKAVAVVDVNEHDGKVGDSPKSRMTLRPRGSDEGFTARPRSFRIDFVDGEEIMFGCDTEEDKDVWMETLTGLIGKIPSNPLWAELLAARQKDKAFRRLPSSSNIPPAIPSRDKPTYVALNPNAARATSAAMVKGHSGNTAITAMTATTSSTTTSTAPSGLSVSTDHSAAYTATSSSGASGSGTAITGTSSSSVIPRPYAGNVGVGVNANANRSSAPVAMPVQADGRRVSVRPKSAIPIPTRTQGV